MPLHEQRRVREVLAATPIELPIARGVAAILREDLEHLGVRCERGRERRHLVEEREELPARHARVDVGDELVEPALVRAPKAVHRTRRLEVIARARLRERFAERGFALRSRSPPACSSVTAPDCARLFTYISRTVGFLSMSAYMYAALREARLVALVVAVLSVAVHVDDDVLLEALPKLRGELRHPDDGLGILLAVHVEHRHAHRA